jgi:hypothetical protein
VIFRDVTFTVGRTPIVEFRRVARGIAFSGVWLLTLLVGCAPHPGVTAGTRASIRPGEPFLPWTFDAGG